MSKKEIIDVEATKVEETKVPEQSVEIVEKKPGKIRELKNKLKDDHPAVYKWAKRIGIGAVVIGGVVGAKKLKDTFGVGDMDLLDVGDGSDTEEANAEKSEDSTEE